MGGAIATSLVRTRTGEPMRAEILTIVDEIKQSLGLLRRHL
jgi:hypothetical protein